MTDIEELGTRFAIRVRMSRNLRQVIATEWLPLVHEDGSFCGNEFLARISHDMCKMPEAFWVVVQKIRLSRKAEPPGAQSRVAWQSSRHDPKPVVRYDPSSSLSCTAAALKVQPADLKLLNETL